MEYLLIYLFGIIASIDAPSGNGPAPVNKPVQIGAYYFNGWYPGSTMLTSSLLNSYKERESKWGWTTSSQDIVDQQILEAANAGISFFSFCWYVNGKTTPINNALKFYRNSQYKQKLKFCLLIANHQGHQITPENWEDTADEWVRQFRDTQYLTVDQKPLLIFFSLESLVKKFGSAENVKTAFDLLRQKAVSSGLSGVTIATCANASENNADVALACGFDLLTGYNYHTIGFKGKSQEVPIDSMQTAEYKYWNKFAKTNKLKYIPVSTLNWDPRPWANSSNRYNNAPYFKGYGQESVYRSVSQIVKWLNDNPKKTTKERIALLYAWNENGEGAYLTPSKNGENVLNGLKKALDYHTSPTVEP